MGNPVNLPTVTDDEFNTILAALRYYQHEGMCTPENRSDWLQDIACPDPGNDTSLDRMGVDELCERLNTECKRVVPTPPKAKKSRKK